MSGKKGSSRNFLHSNGKWQVKQVIINLHAHNKSHLRGEMTASWLPIERLPSTDILALDCSSFHASMTALIVLQWCPGSKGYLCLFGTSPLLTVNGNVMSTTDYCQLTMTCSLTCLAHILSQILLSSAHYTLTLSVLHLNKFLTLQLKENNFHCHIESEKCN